LHIIIDAKKKPAQISSFIAIKKVKQRQLCH